MELQWWSDNDRSDNKTSGETSTRQVKYVGVGCEQASMQSKQEGREKNTSLYYGRKKELKKKKKRLPQYKTTNNLNIKKNQLLEELSSERAFTNVREEKGETDFFYIESKIRCLLGFKILLLESSSSYLTCYTQRPLRISYCISCTYPLHLPLKPSKWEPDENLMRTGSRDKNLSWFSIYNIKKVSSWFSLERELRDRISIRISLQLMFGGFQCMHDVGWMPGWYPALPGIPTQHLKMSFFFSFRKSFQGSIIHECKIPSKYARKFLFTFS